MHFQFAARFKGTCYRAANWKCIGQTFGSGKYGKGYVYHGCIKEVYVYALEPRFREKIGCEKKSYSLFHRPSPSLQKVEALRMILRHAGCLLYTSDAADDLLCVDLGG